jgi:hypothetical protein
VSGPFPARPAHRVSPYLKTCAFLHEVPGKPGDSNAGVFSF